MDLDRNDKRSHFGIHSGAREGIGGPPIAIIAASTKHATQKDGSETSYGNQ